MVYLNRIDIIRCPNCGAEYTAGEIYLPKCFLGVPKHIERDAITHRILYDMGKPMDKKHIFVITVILLLRFQPILSSM